MFYDLNVLYPGSFVQYRHFMWRKGRKEREKLGMITYIRIFRRNVCNVLLPFGKEDFDGGARVFGCFGWKEAGTGMN